MGKRNEIKPILNNEDLTYFIDNGFPCHAYIFTKLDTEISLMALIKSYVTMLRNMGVSHDDIEIAVISLKNLVPATSPIKNSSLFSKWPTQNVLDDYVGAVLKDGDVEIVKKCTTFYSRYDSKKCVCCTCPLSKNYKNANYDDEVYLLSYALSDFSEPHFLSKAGIKAEMFTSMLDVLEHYSSERPLLFPLTRHVFDFVRQKDMQAGFGSSLNSWGDVKAEFVNYIYDKLKKSRFASNIPDSFLVKASAVLIDCFFVKNDEYNPEDIQRSIERLQSGTDIVSLLVAENKGDNTDITTSSNMGVTNVDNYYGTGDRTSEEGGEDVSTLDDSVSVFKGVTPDEREALFGDDEGFEELSNEEIVSSAEDNETPCDNSSQDDAENTVTEDEETMDLSEDEVVDKEDEESEIPLGCMSGATINVDSDDNESVVNEETAAGEKFTYTRENDEEFSYREIGQVYVDDNKMFFRTDGLVGIPIVKKEELEHFCLSLDSKKAGLLSLFESHVKKDGRLCVELIRTDRNKECVLFFSPRLHAHFYTSLEHSMVCEVVAPLLSRPSVVKYTYNGFELMSFLTKKGFYVNSIYSLFALSSFMFRSHTYSMSECLEKLGAAKCVGGVTIRPTGEIESLPILYMHSYPSIFRRGSNMLLKYGYSVEYDERNTFDKIVGMFYDRSNFSSSKDVLFNMVTSDDFRFTKANVSSYGISGDCFTYQFYDIPVDSFEVMRNLLCMLERKGVIKKYRLVLIGCTSSSFSFFIPKEYVDHVRTLINTSFLQYIRANRLHHVDFDVIPMVKEK